MNTLANFKTSKGHTAQTAVLSVSLLCMWLVTCSCHYHDALFSVSLKSEVRTENYAIVDLFMISKSVKRKMAASIFDFLFSISQFFLSDTFNLRKK